MQRRWTAGSTDSLGPSPAGILQQGSNMTAPWDEHAALLAAARACPDDDLVRLVLAMLTPSPFISGLRRLDLTSNWLGPDPAWVVGANLTGLRELNLFCNIGDFERNRSLSEPRPGDPVLAALARAPWAAGLEIL